MIKNIQKIIYYMCLILCFIGLISCTFLQITYYHFNPENVKDNIKLITSNEYEGRLTGSPGNYRMSKLIENQFRQYKLAPLNNTYREVFKVTTPEKNNTEPELSIRDGKKILHRYRYGVDFKDDMVDFRTTYITFTKKDQVDIFLKSFLITHDNKKYLFYVSFDKNFNFRSSFDANSKYEFSVAITTEVYNSILDSLRENKTVTINLPYTLKSEETSNIIGVLKGTSNSLPPLVICAHFDHLGVDALGNHYNGALDNASGTAFMLELSKNLSTFIKPKRDIIFVGLTGEEFGLLGSQKFANDYANIIKESKVINFDMIGAPNTPVSLMTGSVCKDREDDSTSDLLDSFKQICADKKIDYNVKFEDCSDHASFSNKGIDAVTICDSDLSKIHTPKDTVDFIDTTSISTAYSLVEQEIYSYAYDDFILLLYNPKSAILLLIIFISLILIPSLKDTIKNQIHINKNH